MYLNFDFFYNIFLMNNIFYFKNNLNLIFFKFGVGSIFIHLFIYLKKKKNAIYQFFVF